jgi:hypothetical protein
MYPLGAFRQRGLINGLKSMNLCNILLVAEASSKDLIETTVLLLITKAK